MWTRTLGPNVTVVGNGPLRAADRAAIARQRTATPIVRFNDVKTLRAGERTTLRLVRWPSAHAAPCAAPVWYVTHLPPSTLPPDVVQNYTLVYERDKGEKNALDPRREDVRVFPDCPGCGAACDHNATDAGPSTGAVALSALQQDPGIVRIDVYGMNWNGPAYHLDFVNRTLVPRCCTKCVVHPTASASYVVDVDVMGVVLTWVFGTLLLLACTLRALCHTPRSSAESGTSPMRRMQAEEEEEVWEL